MCMCLYDLRGTLLSIQAIHHNLVNRLSITLKKAETSNVHKLLVTKYKFIKQMPLFPADWFVSTGVFYFFFFIWQIKPKMTSSFFNLKKMRVCFAMKTPCQTFMQLKEPQPQDS